MIITAHSGWEEEEMSEHMHSLCSQNSSGSSCACGSYEEGAASVALMCIDKHLSEQSCCKDTPGRCTVFWQGSMSITLWQQQLLSWIKSNSGVDMKWHPADYFNPAEVYSCISSNAYISSSNFSLVCYLCWDSGFFFNKVLMKHYLSMCEEMCKCWFSSSPKL